jgi:hypothetical protein
LSTLLAATVSLCIVLLTACGEPGDETSSNVDAFPRLAATPGMRIGDVDDPSVGFSRVAGVDVDRDGRIYVEEGMVPEIRVYWPDGRLLRRLGRRGRGPGEFEGPPHFGVTGDTVWAFEYGPDRITLFDRDGALLSTGRVERVIVPLPDSYGQVLPWSMRPDGKFTSSMGRVGFSRDDPPSGVKATDSIPVPFVLFDATGAVTDTIGWAGRPPPRMWRPPSEDDVEYQFVDIGGRRMSVPSPPTMLPWWEPLADGYLLVEVPLAENPQDGVFTVTRVGLAGDTVYTRAIHYQPVRYSAADLDTVAARAARGVAGGTPNDWKAIAANLRNAMDFPDTKPPIQLVWVAQDESVWLHLQDGDPASAHWLLLDAQGKPRGQLELPEGVRVMWSRGNSFWAVERDEYDVPWVVHFTMQPG